MMEPWPLDARGQESSAPSRAWRPGWQLGRARYAFYQGSALPAELMGPFALPKACARLNGLGSVACRVSRRRPRWAAAPCPRSRSTCSSVGRDVGTCPRRRQSHDAVLLMTSHVVAPCVARTNAWVSAVSEFKARCAVSLASARVVTRRSFLVPGIVAASAVDQCLEEGRWDPGCGDGRRSNKGRIVPGQLRPSPIRR